MFVLHKNSEKKISFHIMTFSKNLQKEKVTLCRNLIFTADNHSQSTNFIVEK